MKLTMKEGKFGAPVGVYRAKFVGVKPRESQQYGPGLEWTWEIVCDSNGRTDHAGRLVSKTTQPEPSPKNSCGKTINGMAGRVVGMTESVEVSQWIGQVFQIVVETNATGNGTRVGTVMTLGLGAGSPPPTPPQTPGGVPAAGNGAPPPRRKPVPAQAPAVPAVEKFWVDDGSGVSLRTREELQGAVNSAGDPEADLAVMDEAKTCGDWKPPSHFGVQQEMSF
jgi:hypothetical protein